MSFSNSFARPFHHLVATFVILPKYFDEPSYIDLLVGKIVKKITLIQYFDHFLCDADSLDSFIVLFFFL